MRDLGRVRREPQRKLAPTLMRQRSDRGFKLHQSLTVSGCNLDGLVTACSVDHSPRDECGVLAIRQPDNALLERDKCALYELSSSLDDRVSRSESCTGENRLGITLGFTGAIMLKASGGVRCLRGSGRDDTLRLIIGRLDDRLRFVRRVACDAVEYV